jgi:hypothetical protein
MRSEPYKVLLFRLCSPLTVEQLRQMRRKSGRSDKKGEVEMLLAEDGSSSIATIQATPEGPQASFLIKCESGGTTLTETDIQLFQNMDAAMKWLDSAAAKRGFVNFPIHYT